MGSTASERPRPPEWIQRLSSAVTSVSGIDAPARIPLLIPCGVQEVAAYRRQAFSMMAQGDILCAHDRRGDR